MLPHLIPHRAALLALALAAVSPVAEARDLPAAELRALKYYVETGDRRSASAELARLKARYPDWAPPNDLTRIGSGASATDGPGDEANRVWRLIEIGNLEAARGRLDHLKAVHPDWQPPAEMEELLSLAETQAAFDGAIAAGDAPAAIAAVRANPSILRCDRVNNAWQLATMQHKTGDTGAALATYRGVLGSCTDTGVLVATLQKAHSIGTPADTRTLAEFARARRPAARASIDTAEAQLLGAGDATPPAPARTATARPASRAVAAPSTPPARTVPVAPEAGATPPRGALPDTGDARVASVREAARAGAWAQCLDRSTAPRSVDVLYERGWCAYNQNRSLEALAAFRSASTSGLDAVVRRDARFGMILAFLANQMTEDAARLAATTDLTDAQRLQVEAVILDQRGVRAFQQDDFRGSITYLDALERLTGGIRRDLAIMRAYAHLNAGDRRTAYRQFEDLHDQLATPETRKGLNAARG